MKINDFIFRYPYPTNYRRKDGICRVRTFVNSNFDIIAILTDLGEKNTSASVTNSIEIICNSLTSKLFVPKNTIFIEHYENSLYGYSFDIIGLDENQQTTWQRIDFDELKKTIECDEFEFKTSSLQNEILLTEIEKVRTQIDPHIDFPLPLESNYIIRHLEIQNNQINKSSLEDLIKKGANENEILKLLQKDLSIIAELYAHPFDNYICFSEFPLDNGFVDFVIFTGYSRMDVILIEVKGASFNLMNKGSYKKFNSKIEIAMHQIRQRLGYISNNILEVRKNLHEIRERVMNGEKLYNSFRSADDTILVDKNKGINIHNIIIGGRTTNDLEESNKRHEFETNFVLPIKLESWDSFLRKLRRN
ncbi:Shedu anti-phage system protein SduA domain-containing protein [Chryseobacterium sp. JV558]|uniref:Shedu anti-phage system protein SduA domain-containing protein n=1 Tax=Chryseobacterium sp. JV558 TaxID=2663236 RepID=UPI00299D12FF|nr:Shedu anti-phage system protein SduA domain-containing protein [Chryseobacterium sp. JV558]MDW9378815.1 DUF4263 domain-containing protein [Chryseobacterium sp. JV558]